MKPAPFEYHAPDTAADAAKLLAELGDGAKVLAGGQSLIPMLALRLAVFEHLVDIGRIAELKGIERRDGALWIGAGTTQATVEASAEVASAVPLLARATPLIGHFQIRSRGTLGGSIAHADPAAEYPAVALALDASMEVVSPKGRRTIAARDFFDGLWSTSMEPDELLVGVSFPIWSGRSGFAVEEFARRHGDFAIAGADDRRRARRRRPDPALRDRSDRPRVDARASDGCRSRARRPAGHGRRAGRGRAPRDGGPGVGPQRPARLRGVPQARGRRDGGARVDHGHRRRHVDG